MCNYNSYENVLDILDQNLKGDICRSIPFSGRTHGCIYLSER